MSTGLNDPNRCRWCGTFHGPPCPLVKAFEFYPDGVTVKRVEYKTASDYTPPAATPSVGPNIANTVGKDDRLEYRLDGTQRWQG